MAPSEVVAADEVLAFRAIATVVELLALGGPVALGEVMGLEHRDLPSVGWWPCASWWRAADARPPRWPSSR
jgi:hypothetical protein